MNIKRILFPLTLLALSSAAQAGMVTNETGFLTASEHQQLEAWQGETFDLTRIFAKGVNGSTVSDWWVHVEGQGRTFTVFEVFNGADRMVIGGYNSESWVMDNTYHALTPDDPQFIFNLTRGNRYDYSNPNPSYATVNYSNYASTFGTGHDLYVNPSLSNGYTNIGYSYGDRARAGTQAYSTEFAGSRDGWTIGQYETFVLSPVSVTAPEGQALNVSTPAAFGGALAVLMMGWRRARR